MVSIQVGDAFDRVFDRLATRTPVAAELENWTHRAEYQLGRRSVPACVQPAATFARGHRRAAATGPRMPREVCDSADPAFLLGLLSGLDDLFTRATALAAPPPSDRVAAELRLHYRRMGKLNDRSTGRVMPRRTHRTRPHLRSDSLAQALNTLRISKAADARVTWVHLDILDDHDRDLTKLRLSQVPLVTARDIESTSTTSAAGTPVYVLGPKITVPPRIPDAERAMRGTDLGLTAEATLDQQVLEAWLAATNPDSPTWLMVGTGDVDLPATPGVSAPDVDEELANGRPMPVNRAVLVHGPTGRVLAAADKMFGYHIDSATLESYRLKPSPSGRSEGIRNGRHLVVLESTLGRFTILTCEDLDHVVELGALLLELGVSHIINPVIAPALEPWRWQHQAARALGKDCGARVITTNSLAIERMIREPVTDTMIGAGTLMVIEDATPAGLWESSNPDALSQRSAVDALTARRASVSSARLLP